MKIYIYIYSELKLDIYIYMCVNVYKFKIAKCSFLETSIKNIKFCNYIK